MARLLAIASLCYVILHFGFYGVQVHMLWPLQTALIGDLAPALLVFPLHGLRVLCAWYFGMWSVVVMMPTAIVLFIMRIYDPGWDPFSLTYFIIVATYLLSAPISFCIIKSCLARPDDHMGFEWRVIMLTGLLSGLINVVIIGLLNPSYLEEIPIMHWLLARLIGDIAGVFFLLLLVLLALRLTNRALRRFG